jgi:cation diffusion facilitator family transporter
MSQRPSVVSSSSRAPTGCNPLHASSVLVHPSPPLVESTRLKWWQRLCATCRGELPLNHTSLVLQSSLLTNVIIVLTMSSVAIASDSLALLSSLVENMIDLFVQGLLWYAGAKFGKKQDYAKFPAGTSRFEPVAVIVAASIMALVAVMIIQESIGRLVNGFVHQHIEEPKLSIEALCIGGTSIMIKIGLVLYAKWTLKNKSFSSAVEAIMQDNRNDVVSNSFAIGAYVIASTEAKLWFVDATGAIVIFVCIMFAWTKTAREQIMQLVGVCASEEFIDQVKEVCRHHHKQMKLDILRAYHFGTKYLVEIEVVLPAEMTVKLAHDIALQLQFKIEQLDQVERAFVHVDYQERDYDEHIVSRELDALAMYANQSPTNHTSTTKNTNMNEEYTTALSQEEEKVVNEENSSFVSIEMDVKPCGAQEALDLTMIFSPIGSDLENSTTTYQATQINE